MVNTKVIYVERIYNNYRPSYHPPTCPYSPVFDLSPHFLFQLNPLRWHAHGLFQNILILPFLWCENAVGKVRFRQKPTWLGLGNINGLG